MKRRELPAALIALATVLMLVVLIYVGYAVATVFATAAIIYRYALWITHPPTWRYFKAGWTPFLSWQNFRRYTLLIPRAWWTDIFTQIFILKRSFKRWAAHMSIFWGVMLSLAMTLPLTFGWLRFTLVPPDHYQFSFFGLPMFRFPAEAGIGFALFHALDVSAVLLLRSTPGARQLLAGLSAAWADSTALPDAQLTCADPWNHSRQLVQARA